MNTNTMKWLLKREFWEHKGGFFWAPMIGGLVFLGFNVMIALVSIAGAGRAKVKLGTLKLDEAMAHADPEMLRQAGAALDFTLMFVTALVMSISAVVVFFYSIAALYDERRDRSILFWKSLPLSDTATVASKALSALVLAPAIGMTAGMATGLLMMILFGMFGLFYGQNLFGVIFGAASPLKVILVIFSTLPISMLWALPTVGWLMLVSVWARGKPILWAVALPIAAGIMVSWFEMMRSIAMPDTWFWKNVVARMLLGVLPGSWLSHLDFSDRNIHSPAELAALFSLSDIYAVLGRLDLWIGAIAGIGMLILAIRLRRWRDDG